MKKLIKQCKHHGGLTSDECYAYKCFRNTKEGRKEYIGYRCRICALEHKEKWRKLNLDKARAAVKNHYKKNKKQKNDYCLDWQHKNQEKMLTYKKQHALKYPNWQTIASQKYRAKYPEKYKAHQMVFNALKTGKLIKEPCIICKNPKSHAHHDDYNKPLDVRWLCARCHIHAHVEIRKENDKAFN